MVMEKKTKVTVNGLEAEIIETTKFKPPTNQVTARMNIVSPTKEKDVGVNQEE